MKYWDSSAIASLLIEESFTAGLRALRDQDPEQTVWCLTPVEIASALARRVREGLPANQENSIRAGCQVLSERWQEICSLELVRSRALRLLNSHPLRAADALQLAAALLACDERPEALTFVCVDDRLRNAARREGFPVLPA
jgi:predicted nucleic acid-binding protein